jgi:hypothetical protein
MQVSFRHSSSVRAASVQSAMPVPCSTFLSLSPDERTCLLRWCGAAEAIGIDAVEDMKLRRWPCPTAEVVVGVFRRGDELASWLVIGHGAQWVIACCADGTISPAVGSLAEALSLIYPAAPLVGAPEV